MKFLFKAIGTLILGVVIFIGVIYVYTGAMARVGDDFFAAVAANNHQEANTLLSNYIVNNSAPLYAYLQHNNMQNIQSSSWNSRNFVNNKGSIAGQITNDQGQSIPTRMDFLKEDGDWKVYAIAKQDPKATIKPVEPKLQIQEQLVRNSMMHFMNAAQNQSMEVFYNNLSSVWRSQTTVEDLNKAFAPIFDFNGDFNFLSQVKLIIETAVIDDNNLLVIDGYFPLKTSKLVISQKYIYESFEWKLMSFSYKTE